MQIESSERLDPQRRLPILYSAICACLLAVNLFFVLNKIWIGDFWHHAAIIRELSLRPFSPHNPFFNGPPISILYWPFEFGLSLLARLSGFAPITVLSLWGFVNLGLLFFAFHYFTKSISSDHLLPPLSLLMVLFLWGNDPLLFSSFYSFDAIFLVAAYPSTFALAISLITVGLLRQSRSISVSRSIAVVALTTLTIICHPITFLFLGTCLIAIVCEHRGTRVRLTIFLAIGVAFLTAFLWPFFPLQELVFSKNFSADPNGRRVYEAFFSRYWIALAAIPIFISRLRKNVRDFLSLSFFGLAAIYLVGYWGEIWNLGRSIAFIMIFSQLAFADLLLNESLTKHFPETLKDFGVSLGRTATVLFCSVLLTRSYDITSSRPANASYLANLFEAVRQASEGTTILAEEKVSLMIPCLGRKIVVFDCPPFFIDSFLERRNDVQTFFDPGSTPLQKQTVARKYSASYVLVEKQHRNQSAEVLSAWGRPVFENRDWLLVATE